jgi:hypothetical protein
MYEFEDDLGKALERQADRLLGPEFSMWRGAAMEDTGPPEGEPDDGRRHRPIAIVSYDPQRSGSTGNSQLEIFDFEFDTFKLEDLDMWMWYALTDPNDDDDGEELTAVGYDDGFTPPPPPRHDPAPVCSTGFFTVSLKRRRKEHAREQGEKLKVFRPRRRFTHTKPKLAQPHHVKAALMKLRA